MQDDIELLASLRECVAKIRDYTAEGRGVFEQSPLIQEAVVWNLEKMGGAARALSGDIKEATPEIPWAGLERIPQLLFDEFRGVVDLDEIWSIVQDDLPDLEADLAVICRT